MNTPEMIKAALEAGTKERANQLVTEQVGEMMLVLGYTPEDARRRVLMNIGYYTAYLDYATGDKVLELFDTEHPVFGKGHPNPIAEEAYRKGLEFAERMKQKKETGE